MGACNAGENPFNNARVDGLTLAPMELMFVKVKQNMVQLNYPSAVAAVAYGIWQDHAAAVRPLLAVLSLQNFLPCMAVHVWEIDSARRCGFPWAAAMDDMYTASGTTPLARCAPGHSCHARLCACGRSMAPA